MAEIVYVVHCVDTEGPLYESLDARFDRVEATFGLEGLDRSPATLERLRQGTLPLGGKERLVSEALSSHLTNFMEDWEQLRKMLANAMSEEFRLRSPDSFGGGYVYSWFVLDHIGYESNPRRRALGYHTVFDFYRDLLRSRGETRDGLHWHFHPMSTYREAHRCATSLLNSPHVVESLARRIIERNWFPSCVRCGFQTERPDIHWLLEQYIPFDFTNTAVEDVSDLEAQADLANGRFGDWRLAQKEWGVYHPSHDHYQLPGSCRRWIARALNVMNRFANIDEAEVEKAFKRAKSGQPTLLAIASHDHRDLAPEADFLRELLVNVSSRYPDVRYKFCDALEAIRAVTGDPDRAQPLKLKVALARDERGRPHHFTVETVAGRVFGPQPFLAIQTRGGRFIHDNFDLSPDLRSWRYVFDVESVLPGDVAAVGVGANDVYGNTIVEVVRCDDESISAAPRAAELVAAGAAS